MNNCFIFSKFTSKAFLQDKCLNGGTCLHQSYDNGTVQEICACPTNFSGPKCAKCAAIECLNGGTCRLSSSRSYRCDCPDEFEGLYCEIDKCKGYCKNNGVCKIKPVVGPTCQCENNFSGSYCEIETSAKADCKITCQNNGYCRQETDGRESCVCVGNWKGINCELPPHCVDDICGKCDGSPFINECT